MYVSHELSLAFPDMPPDQFARLAADVKANGLHHVIVLYEGAILDGRYRYRACVDGGVEPRFTEYTGEDPVAYVTSGTPRAGTSLHPSSRTPSPP